MTESAPVISVVICTYNRAGICRWALESLCAQTAPADRFEVVLVDNNSSDTTPELAKEFGERLPRFQYARETKQGLSHARNCGMKAANGRYVLYLDDDAKAPAGWVERALAIVADREPDAFGGPFYPFYEGEKPAWFKDEYGSRDNGPEARWLKRGEYLFGGNMAFRRKLLREVGGFDPQFGMTGAALGYGEENEFLDRLRERHSEARIWYDPEFFILHLVKPRLTEPGGIIAHFFNQGRYRARFGPPPRVSPALTRNRPGLLCLILGSGARSLMLLYAQTGVALFARDRGEFPSIWNYVYERQSSRVENLGSHAERLLILLSPSRFRVWRTLPGL